MSAGSPIATTTHISSRALLESRIGEFDKRREHLSERVSMERTVGSKTPVDGRSYSLALVNKEEETKE